MLASFRRQSRKFSRHWRNYIILFGTISLAGLLVIIPAFRAVATLLLKAGGVPFFSPQDIVTLCLQHPLVVLGLVLELFCLLAVTYFEFAVLLHGIVAISQGRPAMREALRAAGSNLRHLRPASLVFLAGYLILVVPFANLIFKTPLLSKVRIPTFVMDYLTRTPLATVLISLAYIIVLVLGLRLIYTLPLMIFRNQTGRQAAKLSWQLTSKGGWWTFIKYVISYSLIIAAITWACYGVFLLCQVGFDRLSGKIPLYSAVINLSLIQIASEIFTVWLGVLLLSLVTKPILNLGYSFSLASGSKKASTLAGVIIILLIAVAGVSNYFYLKQPLESRPVTVSHRGVDEENGVQNTIPALKATAKKHPDYVELDLRETRDHKFVVMHDPNLKALAGIDKTPRELTLKQLTQLTVHENGHRAHIASFDVYLAAAEACHQKLMIEIKSSRTDSPRMIQNFLKAYQRRILADHDIMHSTDYDIVQAVRKAAPRIKIGYIQPYNLIYPQTDASFYSMEYSTINADFIAESHFRHQPIYAWTVNNSNAMKQMMMLGVHGIITDNPDELQAEIRQFQYPSYTVRLLNYLTIISD